MARFKSEWHNRSHCAGMERRVLEAITRRRRQMLVHCYLYYGKDVHVIEDNTWTKWAKQLAQLQRKYGRRIGFYDSLFKDWDGSSGFHLPTNAGVDFNVVRVADRQYEYYNSGAYELSTKAQTQTMARVLAHYRHKWKNEEPLA